MSINVGVSGGVGGSSHVGGSGSIGVGGSVGVGGGVGVGVSGGNNYGGNYGGSSNVGVSVSTPTVKVATPTVGVGISSNSNSNVGIGVNSNSNVGVGVGVSSSGSGNVSSGIKIVGSDDEEQTNTTIELTDSLRSFSVCAVCICCKAPGATTTEPSWNILNCLFAYFCTEFWCCYMCYKRKDWNCFNTKHSCSSCGKYIDTYRSC